MSSVVFFADVLGFATLSLNDVVAAERALDDVSLLFSNEDEIARFLQADHPWTARFGLSDSIFLVADDTVAAAAAASRFFFHLAYLNASVRDVVLMRGGLARGAVRRRGPIFPESGNGNVVGEAIVKAAMLEKSGPKGPRLLLDDVVAHELSGTAMGWLVDDAEGPKELLWVLPPDAGDVDISHLRPVVAAAAGALLNAPEQVAEHYVAYVDLVLRALVKLKTVDSGMAAALLRSFDAGAVADRLERLLSGRAPLELRTLRRLSEIGWPADR